MLETAEKMLKKLEEQGDRHYGLRLTISGGKIEYRVAITAQGEKSLTYIAYLYCCTVHFAESFNQHTN